MKPHILLIMGIFILACGAPVALIEAQPTSTNASSPTANWTNTPETPVYTVTEPLTVRVAPCESSREVAYLQAGTVVTVTEYAACPDGGRWAKIAEEQWVNVRYLQ